MAYSERYQKIADALIRDCNSDYNTLRELGVEENRARCRALEELTDPKRWFILKVPEPLIEWQIEKWLWLIEYDGKRSKISSTPYTRDTVDLYEIAKKNIWDWFKDPQKQEYFSKKQFDRCMKILHKL